MTLLLWWAIGSVVAVLLFLVGFFFSRRYARHRRRSHLDPPILDFNETNSVHKSLFEFLPNGEEACFFPGKKICDAYLAQMMPDRSDIRKSCGQRCDFWHHKTSESIKNSLLRYYEILSSAKISVDLCMFRVSHKRLSQILLYVKMKGAKVRIITDSEVDEGDQLPDLISAGIEVKENKRSELINLMHNKFVVIDKQVVIQGSLNWTHTAENKNHESIIISSDTRLVQTFADKFESMWNDTIRFAPKTNNQTS